MQGRIHIYCGEGKGKTTAAVGLAVRAAGTGMRILMARFLKMEDSGEVGVLRHIPGITVLPCEKEFGFTFTMSEETKKEAKAYYSEMLTKAIQRAQEERVDMLVLDEIMSVYTEELIERELLIEFLKNKPYSMEVVLTGRNPDETLKELADYISEIKKVKHPYDLGVPARRGIEL